MTYFIRQSWNSIEKDWNIVKMKGVHTCFKKRFMHSIWHFSKITDTLKMFIQWVGYYN